MADVTRQHPNQLELVQGTGFFNNLSLLGAASVVVPSGGAFISGPLQLFGFSSFVLFADVVQANPGTFNEPRFRYLDPESKTQISVATGDSPFAPAGAIAGTGVTQQPKWTFALSITGNADIPIFFSLVLTAQGGTNATFSNVRLWCSSAN